MDVIDILTNGSGEVQSRPPLKVLPIIGQGLMEIISDVNYGQSMLWKSINSLNDPKKSQV
jgi:hypothetical protein